MTQIDHLAREYVRLGLHLHGHDRNPYIYLGDPALRASVQAKPMPLLELDTALAILGDNAAALNAADIDGGADRLKAFQDRIAAMQMRSAILQGRAPASFDDEVETLYSMKVPRKDEAHFRALASDLEQVVPGTGALADRMPEFRDRFLIAPEHIQPAMTAALAEARSRTLAHFDLPEGEGITVQMDDAGHFSGFAEYLGSGRTVVHFSRALPLHADRVVELAAHEAYPGHHVQGTLIEAELIGRRGWVEWQMLPLFGAHTVLAEGAANFGVKLAFPRDDRLAFDRDLVLPIAGLTHLSGALEDFHRFVDLVEALNFARNEAARGYLYDGWSRDHAIDWLMEFGLETKGTATQRMNFIEALRSYVVTYNQGLTWVTGQIEHAASQNGISKWSALRDALESPRIPLRH